MLGPDCWGLIFSAACWYGVAQLGLTFTRNGNNEMKFGDRLLGPRHFSSNCTLRRLDCCMYTHVLSCYCLPFLTTAKSWCFAHWSISWRDETGANYHLSIVVPPLQIDFCFRVRHCIGCIQQWVVPLQLRCAISISMPEILGEIDLMLLLRMVCGAHSIDENAVKNVLSRNSIVRNLTLFTTMERPPSSWFWKWPVKRPLQQHIPPPNPCWLVSPLLGRLF